MQAFVCMLVLEMAHGWHGKSACWRLKQKSDQHQSSELGDDPMSNMIRQIMALFDEYQSKENAKHTLRAMKENARQGFWNGALPPIGYRVVEAAEQRGHRTKKTLEIDPIQAETVRLID